MATFADDTAILASHEDPGIASQRLQSELDDLSEWLVRWRVKVNETKSTHNRLKPQYLARYITLVKILPVLESLSNQNRLKPQHLATYITLVKILPVLESLSNQNRLKPQHLATYITLVKILPVLESLPPRIGTRQQHLFELSHAARNYLRHSPIPRLMRLGNDISSSVDFFSTSLRAIKCIAADSSPDLH
ncbi:uncharacterized protein LOC124366877 [Homalodisca vitripennis]|uniref:uncharacterized protein LOC124366877 n=1 Tax=Homalodisca vitripennis TaxID=197043 RepID=UPI001EEAC7A7|nr:uncharacterized protein LOC124366877 [Homalodisca vitripennis]